MRPRLFLAPSLLAVFISSCAGHSQPNRPPRTAEICAVGDIMLARSVEKAVWKNGSDWAMEKMRDEITGADISFANLECPISGKAAMLEKPIAFRAPIGSAKLLADAGFDIVSLANNHAVDCGRDGLVETFYHLKKAGVRWCGAGRDRKEAEKSAVIRVNGLRVAFVAFSEFREGAVKRDKVPTIALAEPGTVGRVVAAAGKNADVVVASFHWGEEYSRKPAREARALAREAVNAGASLVLGHHPHVVQGLETMPRKGGRPALIAWSLGNFIFDQREAPTQEGLLLRCVVGKDGVQTARLEPIRIREYRPVPADSDGKKATLKLVSSLSPAGLIEADGHLNLP